MKITKMHGLGNDYVYVNGFEENIADPPALARRVADRHFGVGGDGLIVIRPATGSEADCRMEMYNADGSRGEMCGNGIRCVAKYVLDRGLGATAGRDSIRIETDAGLLGLDVVRGDGGRVTCVTVDMGEPRTAQRDIPARMTDDDGESIVEAPLEVGGLGVVNVTLVSMGNPHCIVRLGDGQPLSGPLAELPLAELGPLFENHPAFPDRINTEFVVPRGRSEIDFRVWERGSGETLACGTGACAAVVAGVIAGWSDRDAVVHLRGGDLRIRFDEPGGHVFMSGPAIEIFTAELDPAWLASP